MELGFRKLLYLLRFRIANRKKPFFKCPICNYFGPFADRQATTGLRKHAKCPSCHSFERHRLQRLVIDLVMKHHDLSKKAFLHFAPEDFFYPLFKKAAGQYTTADRYMPNVDVKVDLRSLPFSNETFDFIYASHVLEHIKEDDICLGEISRVLSKKGIAILPVPIVAEKTIEYPSPNPKESGHVRAPGPDYYERYLDYFSKVETYTSDYFSDEYQIYVYEDRRQWPNENMPLRMSMKGNKHMDIVSVCFA